MISTISIVFDPDHHDDADDADDDDDDWLTLLVGRAVSHESVVVANLQNKRDGDHIIHDDNNNNYDDEHNNDYDDDNDCDDDEEIHLISNLALHPVTAVDAHL